MTVDEVRSTPQRRAVLDIVRQADDHPTAADVLERVCEVLPGVGAATVYRTLALLVESGQIAEVRLGHSSAVRYDRTIDHHDHLVCVQCDKVVDDHLTLDHRKVFGPLAARHGFRVTGYDLRVHGVCTECDAAATVTTTTTKGNPHG
jgi:Fur family transcriptional regulator, peroxide stress response regulator